MLGLVVARVQTFFSCSNATRSGRRHVEGGARLRNLGIMDIDTMFSAAHLLRVLSARQGN